MWLIFFKLLLKLWMIKMIEFLSLIKIKYNELSLGDIKKYKEFKFYKIGDLYGKDILLFSNFANRKI